MATKTKTITTDLSKHRRLQLLRERPHLRNVTRGKCSVCGDYAGAFCTFNKAFLCESCFDDKMDEHMGRRKPTRGKCYACGDAAAAYSDFRLRNGEFVCWACVPADQVDPGVKTTCECCQNEYAYDLMMEFPPRPGEHSHAGFICETCFDRAMEAHMGRS